MLIIFFYAMKFNGVQFFVDSNILQNILICAPQKTMSERRESK